MRNNIRKLRLVGVVLALSLGYAAYLSVLSNVVFADSTSNFTQTINPGTLSVDIVDGSYASVGSPSVTMNSATFSFTCQTTTGTFGSATQQIYIKNPDAADSGWTVSLASAAPTNTWHSTNAAADIDFNDANGSGCTDGVGDADTKGGQMSVDASVGTLAIGNCSSCTTGNITKGSSDSFVEGTKNSITILTAAAGSDDIGDWTLRGVSVSQKIPGETPSANDYNINLTLSII